MHSFVLVDMDKRFNVLQMEAQELRKHTILSTFQINTIPNINLNGYKHKVFQYTNWPWHLSLYDSNDTKFDSMNDWMCVDCADDDSYAIVNIFVRIDQLNDY